MYILLTVYSIKTGVVAEVFLIRTLILFDFAKKISTNHLGYFFLKN